MTPGLLILAVCVTAVVVAAAMFLVGRGRGAREANRRWTEYTGITPAELERRQFDRELRQFRRHIGRPADDWPEQSRED
jgi:hypothetical protein